MRLKSETFISSYIQKMTWKSFFGDLGFLHILIVNLFNFDAVVLKFTISNNKPLKLCNY